MDDEDEDEEEDDVPDCGLRVRLWSSKWVMELDPGERSCCSRLHPESELVSEKGPSNSEHPKPK